MILFDALLSVFVLPAGAVLWIVRRIGVWRLKICKRVLLAIGVFPIRNHYYEPRFDYRGDDLPPRKLPGIDWNVDSQVCFLKSLSFTDEVKQWPLEKPSASEFGIRNDAFGPGDAEIWYQLLRKAEPSRIIEIGSGQSTILASMAIRKNSKGCHHTCIEPFEAPWLESLGVEVIRKPVEHFDTAYFQTLGDGDVLFIDSSHIIRPGGDVLFEVLELLPSLRPGVIVHIHDIFSPSHYSKNWRENYCWFWNEQYLLEAFLTHNSEWEILLALNYLQKNHATELQRCCPHLRPNNNPGSIYIRRITDNGSSL